MGADPKSMIAPQKMRYTPDSHAQSAFGLQEKEFLAFNSNEMRLGQTNKLFENVNFGVLNELDFETNKQKVMDALGDIDEEEEDSFMTMKFKGQRTQVLNHDIQLL